MDVELTDIVKVHDDITEGRRPAAAAFRATMCAAVRARVQFCGCEPEEDNKGRGIMNLEGRHPATQHFGPLFAFEHLPEHLRVVSAPCADLAEEMITALPDGPELSAGLRKLLEAKDCFVRAALFTDA